MDKYDAANDHYCYPGTTVLKNKLAIKDAGRLEDAERDITGCTSDSVRYQSPPYDLSYLKTLHSSLFSPLYEWAGCIRDVNISKGGTTICVFSRIESETNKLFLQLANENWLSGLSAGYELDWSNITSEEWLEANIEGVYVNYEPLAKIFSRVLR